MANLRRSATEAQLGLGFEVELLECAGIRSGAPGFEFDLQSPVSSFRSRSSWVRVREIVRIGFSSNPGTWKMLSECSLNPPEYAPGGTPEMLPGDRPGTPGRDTEKDHFEQLAKNHHTVGDSSRKCRVGSIRSHPVTQPIPPQTPPSHPLKGMAYATTPARAQCELP